MIDINKDYYIHSNNVEINKDKHRVTALLILLKYDIFSTSIETKVI